MCGLHVQPTSTHLIIAADSTTAGDVQRKGLVGVAGLLAGALVLEGMAQQPANVAEHELT